MLKKVFLASGTALVMFILFAIWDSRTIERHAESFLSEWNSIKLGDNPEHLRLMSKQFGARYSRPSQDCNATNCEYFFGFYNIWIYRLDLAPRRVFGARVMIADDKITYKELIFEQGRLQAAATVRDVDCYPCKAASKPYHVSINGLNSYVTLTPASSAEERALSYQFNLKFLMSPKSLKSVRDLQPSVVDYVEQQIKQGRLE